MKPAVPGHFEQPAAHDFGAVAVHSTEPRRESEHGAPQRVTETGLTLPLSGVAPLRRCACGGATDSGGSECTSCRFQRRMLQAKLAVSTPGDAYEQEADRIADAVTGVRGLARAPVAISRFAAQPGSAPQVSDATAARIDSLRGRGQPLSSTSRSFFEPRLSADLRDVRVHTDTHGADTADQVGAVAFTVGNDIVFARGAYSPESPSGQRLLAHELVHALQTRRGGLSPTTVAPAHDAHEPETAERAFFEPRVGGDLGRVGAGQAAERLGAGGFTVGSDIARAPAEDHPGTGDGQRLPAHESAHVVQQPIADTVVLRRQPRAKLPWEKRMRQSGPADWQAGMRATLVSDIDDEDHVAPGVWFNRGSVVEVLSVSFGQVQVQLLDPKARTTKPFYIDGLRLEPIGPAASASGTHEGAQPPSAKPAAPKHMRETATQERGQTHFHVQLIDEATARSLGVEPASLPEGRPVPLPAPAPGIGIGGASAPWPAFPVSPHGTGVQWTQTLFGHFSQFSNVPGSPTIGGYRSWGAVHGYQGLHGKFTRQPWTTPVPGGYFNDWWFRLMSPGTQTLVWREGTPQHAELVAELIQRGEYAKPYSFPPSAPGTKCTNCITAPRTETFGALGGRPVVVADSGVYDITEFGQGSPDEPFTIEQAGRGRTMREWLTNPAVQTPTGEIEPLNVTKVPASTVWGTRGVAAIRVGGVIMLIYGAYTTAERLEEAAGTPYFGRVAAQETGSWIGGVLGGALGAAGAAAVACTPAGPGAFVCAAAGFVLGLAGGAAGSMLGAMGADHLYQQAHESIETAGKILDPMAERAIWGNSPIPTLGYYPPRQFGQDPDKYEEQRKHEMRSWGGRGF